VARIAAHELGHGVFRLYHTFSSKNVVTLTQGTTDNLMDYSSNTTATALYKYQWDYIHNPQTMLFAWAEEEEEGASSVAPGELTPESFIVSFRGESPNVFYIKKGNPLTSSQETLLRNSMFMDNTETLKRWQPETDIIKFDVLSDLRNIFFFEIISTNNTEELKSVNGIFL